MRKSLVLVLMVLIGVSALMAFPRGNGGGMMGGNEFRSDRHEEMQALRDKIVEQHEKMFEANREKIQKLRLEQEKLALSLKEEMMKDNPDWKKVSGIMDDQKANRDDMWKIHKDQQLTIMKSLTKEERDLFGFGMGMMRQGGHRPQKGGGQGQRPGMGEGPLGWDND